MTARHLFPSCLLTLLLTTSGFAQQAADAIAPEDDTGVSSFEGLSAAAQDALAAKAAGTPVVAEDWMIAAATP